MTRLHSDHMAPSAQRLGRQDGGLVPCSRSKHHPHHPAMEDCMWCEPKKPALTAAKRTLGQSYYEYMYPDLPWAELPPDSKDYYQSAASDVLHLARTLHGGTPTWARGLDLDLDTADTLPPHVGAPFGAYP